MERADKQQYLREKMAELIAQYPGEVDEDGFYGRRLRQYLHLLDLELEGELVSGDGSAESPLVPVMETDSGELWYGTGTPDEVRHMPEELLRSVKDWMSMKERQGRRDNTADIIRDVFRVKEPGE